MQETDRTSYRGGEELRRAAAVLAGPVGNRTEQTGGGTTLEDTVPGTAPSQQLHRATSDLVASADAGTRELAVAAERYAEAAANNADDFEAVYNHGLALQELATRSGNDRQLQYRLLKEACQNYEIAWSLRNNSHACAYNWGVALSDLAKHHRLLGNLQEAETEMLDAAHQYAVSLKWNPNNPQALNNWGLLLQDLAATQPKSAELFGVVERDYLMAASIMKFRQAIRLRPEFDRACYNLGTVLYSYATELQSEVELSRDTSIDASSSGQAPLGGQHHRQGAMEKAKAYVDMTFQLAAQYITLAQALQPAKEVYRKSMQVLRHMLPLPALRSGYLRVPAPDFGNWDPTKSRWTVYEKWHKYLFVLDGSGLRSVAGTHQQPGEEARVNILASDMRGAKTADDPSLKHGAALWLQLTNKSTGEYLVADTQGDADGWVDALLLVAHLSSINRLGTLQQILQPSLFPP